VKDHDDSGRRSGAKLLTKDEARRIAANSGEAAAAFTPEGLKAVRVPSHPRLAPRVP